jgi:hypothetical protein
MFAVKNMLLFPVLVAVLGCATDSSYQKLTSEFTGCSADNVQVSDVNHSGSNSWKAICKSDARIYACTRKGCSEVK